MKHLMLIVPSFLALGTGWSQNAGNSKELDGLWQPIKEQVAGSDLNSAGFEKDRLSTNDTVYSYTNQDKGAVYYKDGKMDIYGREGINAGKHFMAIYKLDKDQLTVCYNLAGDGYPTAFESASKPTLFLAVFQRVQ